MSIYELVLIAMLYLEQGLQVMREILQVLHEIRGRTSDETV